MNEIILNRFRGQQGFVALVDDQDFELVNQYNWCINKNGNTCYAVTHIRVDGKRKMLKMHRLIMNPEPRQFVDHRDGNGLDNQRSNLRFSTSSQNSMNRKSAKNSSSKYLGVFYNKSENKWQSSIKVNGKAKHIGYFPTEQAAALAYNTAALKYHGEFARLNVI